MLDFYRTFIEQPIFNLLEVIYALVPGHDLGVAIIIFTALIRLMLWPLVRKQLHHSRRIRALQPELKKIKKATKGDRQLEVRLQRELYKEHEINPLSTIWTLVVQIPIFIGLYHSVLKLINDTNTLQTFSYSWVRELPWIEHLATASEKFDASLFGIIDLSQKGFSSSSGIYVWAIFLAAIAALAQYYQSKHLLSDQKDARKLREILKEAAAGKETDQSEVTAAITKGMLVFMPIMTFIFSINLPAALSLYFLTSSVVGYFQQRIIFSEDVDEMALLNKDNPKVISLEEKLEKLKAEMADSKADSTTTEADSTPAAVKKTKSGKVDLKVTISSPTSSSKTKNKPTVSAKNKKKRRR